MGSQEESCKKFDLKPFKSRFLSFLMKWIAAVRRFRLSKTTSGIGRNWAMCELKVGVKSFVSLIASPAKTVTNLVFLQLSPIPAPTERSSWQGPKFSV